MYNQHVMWTRTLIAFVSLGASAWGASQTLLPTTWHRPGYFDDMAGGMGYLYCRQNGSVRVIDEASGKVARYLSSEVGRHAASPTQPHVVVYRSGRLQLIRVNDGVILADISSPSSNFVFNPTGTRLYLVPGPGTTRLLRWTRRT